MIQICKFTICTLLEDDVRQLDGFKLFLSNNTEGVLSQQNYTPQDGFIYTASLPNVLVRIIELQRIGILTICEVEVSRGGKFYS